MLRVAVAVAMGILLAEWLHCAVWVVGCVAGAGIILLAVATFARMQWMRRLYLPLLWLTLLAVGWMLATLRQPDPLQGVPATGWDGVSQMRMRLDDTPRSSLRTYSVVARVEAVCSHGQWLEADCPIMLSLQKDSASAALHYGDCLIVQGYPRWLSGEENPYQFNYRRYLLRNGIGWQCYVPMGKWRMEHPVAHPAGLKGWSKYIQQRLVERIRQCRLTPQQQGIAEALLLGYRVDLDADTLQQFRDAGVMHLLCVSGLHVGIVAWLVGLPFFFLGRRRWHRMVKGCVRIVGLWFFVWITGMAPSSLRAGVMFSLMLVGDMVQQRSNTLNNICTSALLMLLVSPALLFNTGFQFSYAAVLGIRLWHQPLQRLLPIPHGSWWWYLPRYVWQLACLSTAAQLGSLPLVLYHFHDFPLYFLVANLTVVPFAGLLLATIMGMVLVQPWPTVCSWATWLLRQELVATDAITRWVGQLPHAMLQGLYCDLPIALLIVAALVALTLILQYRWRAGWPVMAGCLLAMVLYLTVVNIRAVQQHEVVVYAAGRHLAVECFDGRRSYMVCDVEVARNPMLIEYQREGLLLHRRITSTTLLPVDTLYADGRCSLLEHRLRFDNRKILLIDKSNATPRKQEIPRKEKLDAVIVAPCTWVDTATLRSNYPCDTLLYRYGFTVL